MPVFERTTASLPEDYAELNARTAIDIIRSATAAGLSQIEAHERAHKERSSVLNAIEKRRRTVGSDAEPMDEAVDDDDDEDFDDDVIEGEFEHEALPDTNVPLEHRAALGALSLVEIAALHGVPLFEISEEYEKGMEVEMRQIPQESAAAFVVKRRLAKTPNYYGLVDPNESPDERMVFGEIARPKLKVLVTITGAHIKPSPLTFENHYTDIEFIPRLMEDALSWMNQGLISKRSRVITVKLQIIGHNGGHPLKTHNHCIRSLFLERMGGMAADLYGRYAYNRSKSDPRFMGNASEEGEEGFSFGGMSKPLKVIGEKVQDAIKASSEYRTSQLKSRPVVDVREFMGLPEVLDLVSEEVAEAAHDLSPRLGSFIDNVRELIGFDDDDDDEEDDEDA
jgi:hypothetical protein